MTLFYRERRKCWYGNPTIDGKRFKRRLHPRKQEAKRIHAEWVSELEARYGERVIDPTLTLRAFLDHEYLPWSREAKGASTVQREDLAFRVWFELVGDLRLARIDEWVGARFQTARHKTCTARTVNHDLGVISQVLNRAVDWGRLDRNRLKGCRKLREVKREPRWLSVDEISALVAAVPRRLLAMVIVFLNCGLRREEAQRLEWSDVDLTSRTLTVRHHGEVTTKSRKERIVDLNDLAVRTLRDHRRAMRAKFRALPRQVFVTLRGTPIRNNLLRDIQAAYAKAGIEGANIHSLRHTFGAQSVMAGVDLPTLKELMGHASITTTMMYAHLDRKHRAAAVNKLALGAPQRTADVIPMERGRTGEVG